MEFDVRKSTDQIEIIQLSQENGDTTKKKKALIISLDGQFDGSYDKETGKGLDVNPNELFGIGNLNLNLDENDIYAILYKMNCTGLKDAAAEISDFLSSIGEEYDSIVLMGVSKGGTTLFEALKYIDNDDLLRKIDLVTAATPYNGSPMANDEEMKRRTRRIPLLGLVIYKYWKSIFTGKDWDTDSYEESEFIKNLGEDVSFLGKIHSWTNGVTRVYLGKLWKVYNEKGLGFIWSTYYEFYS